MSDLRCGKCEVRFDSRDVLAMHMLEHSVLGEREDLLKNSRTPLNVNGLIEIHNAAMRLNLCSVAISSKNGDHHDTEHLQQSITIQCEICFEVFDDRDSLAMHTLSHANEGPSSPKLPARADYFPCQYCRVVFSYKDMLELHIKAQHRLNNNPLDLRVSRKRASSPVDKELHSLPTDQRVSHSHNHHQTKVMRMDRAMELTPTTPIQTRVKTEPSIPKHACLPNQQNQQQCLDQQVGHTTPMSPLVSTGPTATPRGTVSSNPATHTSLPQIAMAQASRMDCSIGGRFNGGSMVSGPIELHRATNENQLNAIKQMMLEMMESFYLCPHCNIIFLDRAMFYLHNGLHNRCHPWQCNICGKICKSSLEFSAHVIHT